MPTPVIPVLSHVDHNKNEIRNVLVQSLASAPASPVAGLIYYDTSLNQFGCYQNGVWVYLTAVSNLTLSIFAVNVIDTDTNLAANSDTRLATQKATKAYVDTKVTSATKFLGAMDASANPNWPLAKLGDEYKISVGGLMGGGAGRAVKVGDIILCTADSAAGNEATVGPNWDVLETTADQASTTVAGNVQLATLAEAEAKSLNTKALTPASVANFSVKKTFVITGDGATTSFACNHSLNSQLVQVQVFDGSYNQVLVATQNNTVNQSTIVFGTAPGNLVTYNVVIIG